MFNRIYLQQTMKKAIFSIALACISGLTAHAQLNGDGFYRIQNANTGRYMTLADRHSRGANSHTATVDAGALATRKNWSDIENDPGSVFYIQKVNSSEYNILAQGIDMHQLINYYIRIESKDGGKTYKFWQTDSGTRLYLSDEDQEYQGTDNGFVVTKGQDTRDWKIIPLDNTSSNYIGITPLVKANNGKYYATYLAGFPFSLQSSGMKAYTLTYNAAVANVGYQEVTGDIPASTPVLIECNNADAKSNLIQPLVNSSNKVNNHNDLQGVFFSLADWISQHYNYLVFDANTMRYLGINASGDLVFNNSNEYMATMHVFDGKQNSYYQAIPHNTAYIKVAAGAASELKVVDQATGITPTLFTQDEKAGNVYNLMGTLVRKNATSVEGLPQGIYIFKGKKVVVK